MRRYVFRRPHDYRPRRMALLVASLGVADEAPAPAENPSSFQFLSNMGRMMNR